jgi:class 3 adenylate cyclase
VTELPTGTVTFLFTDLEGSTRLWEEHPGAMHSALARHDQILRDAIAANGGYLVKTTGDGFHAAFPTSEAALRTAVAMQRSLGSDDWGEIGALRVRVGVHTGAAEYRDGDYYGTALNRAARLMSAAHGGQVVVSLATEQLVRDTMPDGTALVDLGEHRLRDLGHPERVFQLGAPGLSDQFPPLRSLDAFPGNLPLQLTSFVGRDDAYETVAWIWVEPGRDADAARLMGAVAAVRDAIGASGDLWGAARREAVRSALTDRLTPADLEHLTDEGRAMSRDDMRRFVLEETGRA